MSSPLAGIGRFDMAAGADDTGNPAKGNIEAEAVRAIANSRRRRFLILDMWRLCANRRAAATG